MGKLIRLEIQGEFNLGFSITANIEKESDNRPIARSIGKLADNLQLLERYRNWQAIYQSIVVSFSTFSLQRVASVSNISDKSAADNLALLKEATDLISSFNAWLKDEAFLPIESLLRNHLNTNEENRILLLTDNPWLRKLPWQEWDLLRDFPQTEIGFASPKFKQIQQLSPTSKDGVKILGIFGYQADVESQGQAIQNLEKNVEVTWLEQPKREELDEPLWKQRWDIIFFVGHGGSQDEWKTGTIWINETDKITISELRNHLKKAIENGLKLAILNCCDGLGLAHSLAEGEDLYLPQMIVMREELPVAVAPRFLKYFMEEFTQDKSLYASVREARQRLQILEKDFPCASWLPVICQNPAENPVSWPNLYDSQITPMPRTPPGVLFDVVLNTLIILLGLLGFQIVSVAFNLLILKGMTSHKSNNRIIFTFDILTQLQPPAQIYLLPINIQSLADETDTIAICQELCTLIYSLTLPDTDIPTVSNFAQLKQQILTAKKQLEKPHLALIFHNCKPHPPLLTCCRKIADANLGLHILWITDEPLELPLRGFPPSQDNLLGAIQTWLEEC